MGIAVVSGFVMFNFFYFLFLSVYVYWMSYFLYIIHIYFQQKKALPVGADSKVTSIFYVKGDSNFLSSQCLSRRFLNWFIDFA